MDKHANDNGMMATVVEAGARPTHLGAKTRRTARRAGGLGPLAGGVRILLLAILLAGANSPALAQLARCPDCQAQVSPRAEKCPGCGCPAAHFVADKDASASVNQSVLLLRATFKGQELAVGTASLVSMGGVPYVVTNQHLVAGTDGLEFQTTRGQKLVPTGAEVLAAGDLIRLRVDAEQLRQLGLSPLPLRDGELRIGETVTVFGNSGGAGVITRLDGKVVGVSATLLEIDATFIGGNSGSPVIGADGAVLGVATFASWNRPDWVAQNTRFADVRRFSLRVPAARDKWRATTLDGYQGVARKLYDIENFARCSAVVFTRAEKFVEVYKPSDVRAMFADTAYVQKIFAHVQQVRQWALLTDVDRQVAGLRAECRKMEEDLLAAKRLLAAPASGWLSSYLGEEAERISYVVDQCLLLARQGIKVAGEVGQQRREEQRAIDGDWQEIRDALWRLQGELYNIRVNMVADGPRRDKAYRQLRELMHGQGLEGALFIHYLGYAPKRYPDEDEVKRVETVVRNAFNQFNQAKTEADKLRCLRQFDK